MSFCSGGTTGPRTLIRVRVNDELVLDAGSSAQATGPHGAVEVVLPPQTTLFHLVLAYLEEKPPSRTSTPVPFVAIRSTSGG